MKLSIPDLSLVVLVGASGSGKTTFARRNFLPTEVISSDVCRGLVSDDENSQEATDDAFDVLQYIAGKRLERGKLTVIDATNVREESRRPLVMLAREHDVLPVAVVLNLGEEVCRERNRSRTDRTVGPHVVRQHCTALRQSLRRLKHEGFRYVYVLDSPEEVEAATIERVPLWTNRREDHGPFDIIGDVHGCYDELVALLRKLGHCIDPIAPEAGNAPAAAPALDPPASPPCKIIFLGDLIDRGPDSVSVLKLVMSMVEAGTALCVPGNHDVKLLKKLRGRDVQLTHGLAETLRQLDSQPPEFRRKVADFIDSLVSHFVLDDGRLVVAHAGMKEKFIGRASGRVRDFALYGETTGESDDLGLPVRLNWAADYRGRAAVVYGHTPVAEPTWHNNTLNIDTGCAFGGKLSALRWPEKELVSVPAKATYALPSRPFLPDSPAPPHREFGEKSDGHVYRTRPGAYGIIPGEKGSIAVMKIGGRYFLPGGGMEDGETPVEALERESLEECGRALQVGRKICEATQLINSDGRPHLAKHGHFYEATFVGAPVGACERDHTLLWLAPDEVRRRLRHEAQSWAVQVWASALPATSKKPGERRDDTLDIDDVLGKRVIHTRLASTVVVREENAAAALEVMSRFAADPRWLVYLPPTMSPSETTREPGLLEHPHEAFAYYRAAGVETVVCQEKHMGSRAVAVVCRDESAAAKHLGIEGDGAGIVYTRTGRRFFEDRAFEGALLEKLRAALSAAEFWQQFNSDWFCLDCELMPWSAKAQDLLKRQYAPVGSAARSALAETLPVLEAAAGRYLGDAGMESLLAGVRSRLKNAQRFVSAYRRYCWPVTSVEDLKLAPFHVLASEGKVHTDRDHVWHMKTLAQLAEAGGAPLMATAYRLVEVNDAASVAEGVAWWEQLTAAGGEGMVVKPLAFIARGRRGVVQPAVKCRGREYLRIIYGPDYTAPQNLERLRNRGLNAKRALAIREFALGLEALDRFVAREPLHRIHECVFGVLALESEPVDPRL